MSRTVYCVNAFSQNDQGGNLAGVVLGASGMTDIRMQSIANKVGASETAFLFQPHRSKYQLRFFTPSTEVSMCGHATVAVWYLLAKMHRIKPGYYTQQTSAGTVKINVDSNEHVYLAISKFSELGTVPTSEISDCLGIPVGDFAPDFAPEIISDDLIIKVRSTEILGAIKPDFEKMIALSKERDFYAFHVFCDSEDKDTLADVRSFAPRVGIQEDAATGTGNAAMLYLLSKRGLLPASPKPHGIKQGESLGHPSVIYAEIEGNDIWVGGKATLVKQIKL